MIEEILSVKKIKNSWHNLDEGSAPVRSQGFMRAFKVLKRNSSFWLLIDTWRDNGFLRLSDTLLNGFSKCLKTPEDDRPSNFSQNVYKCV